MQQLVLFQTGNMQFALDRDCIDDIRPIPEASTQARSRIQQQSIEIDGRPLLLIDFAAASNHDTAATYPSHAKMIMVRISPPLALLADSVKPAIDASTAQMDELPPVFAGTARACFPKVLCLKGQVALVIDAAALPGFETCSGTSAADQMTRQNRAEQDRETSLAASGVRLKASSNPRDAQAIETIIAEKLQNIIRLRVRQAVARIIRQRLGQMHIKSRSSTD